MVELARRSFLTGLGAVLVAAPAIVRATSIMPVKRMPVELRYDGYGNVRVYSGYDVVDNDLSDLLYRRIDAAQRVLATNLRESLDRIIYLEGTGASSGGLAALFNG
jgi:hypothetical protein